MECKITVYRCQEAEIDILVFGVVLSDDRTEWQETYGSLIELNAFLRGVKAGICFKEGHILGDYLTIPNGIRELPGGWNLHRAPYQLWPDELAEDIRTC